MSLRWGIVSAGRIARQFCSDLRFVEGAVAAGVAARKIEDAEAFKAEFQVEQAFATYEEMFNHPDIDAVYIATPHTFHLEHSLAAIKAGKHVLCEKPVTVSVAQMQQIRDAATEAGVFFMEAMWTYYLPAMQQAKAWVDAGRIGEIKHVKADFGYPVPYLPEQREFNPDLGGGCLLDMGIYPIAIAQYFLGQHYRNMQVSSKMAPNGVELDLSWTMEFDTGTATLGTSFDCRLPNVAYIIGDGGYIEIPDAFRASECRLYVIDDLVDEFKAPRESNGLDYETRAVGELIANGELESPIVPHSTSLWFQKVMEEVKSHC